MDNNISIEKSLQAIWNLWDGDELETTTTSRSVGRSRHARRRRNCQKGSSWERELRRQYLSLKNTRSIHQEDSHEQNIPNADLWLRSLVHASWTWGPTPDFFSDLFAAALALGVRVPMRVPSQRLLGPSRQATHGVISHEKRIEQRESLRY